MDQHEENGTSGPAVNGELAFAQAQEDQQPGSAGKPWPFGRGSEAGGSQRNAGSVGAAVEQQIEEEEQFVGMGLEIEDQPSPVTVFPQPADDIAESPKEEVETSTPVDMSDAEVRPASSGGILKRPR